MNKYLLVLSIIFLTLPILGQEVIDKFGAIIRSDTIQKHIYLCFTAHDFNEGFGHVLKVLKKNDVKGSFFFTGDFVRNNWEIIQGIKNNKHFIGAHSDKHLLYCDWGIRDSLLHTPDTIKADIENNLTKLKQANIFPDYFMPPYEWYNTEVVKIAKSLDQKVVNFSPGTRSNADYTTPKMSNYISSEEILKSIYEYEESNGMNGFHLLIHPGTSPERADKLYYHLDSIIQYFQERGYTFKRFK